MRRSKKSRINGVFSTIRAGSKFPSTYSDLQKDMDDWDCNSWRIYYERNKLLGGKAYAKEIMLLDYARLGWFANALLCKYDCGFVQWGKDELGIDFMLISDIICGVGDVAESGLGAAANIAKSTETVTSIIIPIALIGGGIWAYDKYRKK